MPITLDGTLGITTPSYGGADAAEYLVPVTAFKNRIINGAMVIDQRNAGALISAPTSGQYTVDRWWYGSTQTSKMSFQQNAGSVTPPTGFTNYAGLTSSSAYSVSSSDIFFFEQVVEGFNCADLDWGTANAKTVTLSFWVRSSLTGTFGGALANSAHNRSYPFSYTISAANTWEQKSVTIAGDTSGTWLTNNGVGIQIIFGLGGGSTRGGTAGSWSGSTFYTATGATSVVGTNGATFYITGVQLEVGSTATSFDYRPYGTELALCQRYFFALEPIQYFVGKQNGSTGWTGTLTVPVPLRASPTLSFSGSPTFYLFSQGGLYTSTTNSVTLNFAKNTYINVNFTGFSGLTDNFVGNVRFDNVNLLISAEL